MTSMENSREPQFGQSTLLQEGRVVVQKTPASSMDFRKLQRYIKYGGALYASPGDVNSNDASPPDFMMNSEHSQSDALSETNSSAHFPPGLDLDFVTRSRVASPSDEKVKRNLASNVAPIQRPKLNNNNTTNNSNIPSSLNKDAYSLFHAPKSNHPLGQLYHQIHQGEFAQQFHHQQDFILSPPSTNIANAVADSEKSYTNMPRSDSGHFSNPMSRPMDFPSESSSPLSSASSSPSASVILHDVSIASSGVNQSFDVDEQILFAKQMQNLSYSNVVKTGMDKIVTTMVMNPVAKPSDMNAAATSNIDGGNNNNNDANGNGDYVNDNGNANSANANAPRSDAATTATLTRQTPPPNDALPVLKMSNIPWDLSITDVINFFHPIAVPHSHLPPFYTQGVHIVMNRSSGKTLSESYVEFTSQADAEKAIAGMNKTILKGRVITLSWASQKELYRVLFPSWKGHWETTPLQSESNATNVQANGSSSTSNSPTRGNENGSFSSSAPNSPRPPPNNGGGVFCNYGAVAGATEKDSLIKKAMELTLVPMNALSSGVNLVVSASSKDGVFITREEINAILIVCRHYKVHFSRKCAERPFENVISIVSKLPWHVKGLISSSQRVFELMKLSIETLRSHMSKVASQISHSLIERMVRAGFVCAGFTDRQKLVILYASKLPAPPPDLVKFLFADLELVGAGANSQGKWVLVLPPPTTEQTGESQGNADGEQTGADVDASDTGFTNPLNVSATTTADIAATSPPMPTTEEDQEEFETEEERASHLEKLLTETELRCLQLESKLQSEVVSQRKYIMLFQQERNVYEQKIRVMGMRIQELESQVWMMHRQMKTGQVASAIGGPGQQRSTSSNFQTMVPDTTFTDVYQQKPPFSPRLMMSSEFVPASASASASVPVMHQGRGEEDDDDVRLDTFDTTNFLLLPSSASPSSIASTNISSVPVSTTNSPLRDPRMTNTVFSPFVYGAGPFTFNPSVFNNNNNANKAGSGLNNHHLHGGNNQQ